MRAARVGARCSCARLGAAVQGVGGMRRKCAVIWWQSSLHWLVSSASPLTRPPTAPPTCGAEDSRRKSFQDYVCH